MQQIAVPPLCKLISRGVQKTNFLTGDNIMSFDRETALSANNDTFSAPNDTRKDKIRGLGGNDVINGMGGDDEIWGDGEFLNLFDALVVSGHDKLSGGKGNDSLHGGAGNDQLLGDEGNDTLFGDDGDDRLNGGTGSDLMKGGFGNDVYVVDSTGDRVEDVLLGGTDTVESFINYDLRTAAFIENLTLLGTSALNGIGNNDNNQINGNSANNTLSGLDGNDRLSGHDGNDVLNGGNGNDSLFGGNGDDVLNGGAGQDTLKGEAGNDTFIIDSSSGTDVIDGGTGTDQVNSSVSFSLATTLSVENLLLTGTAAVNGTGNSLANTITGNSASNTLNGGDGNDVLNGGSGNDVINGDAGDDRLFEGDGNDVLNGGSGNDVLDGGAGRDRYNGGTGNDHLTFDAADLAAGAVAGQYDGGSGVDQLNFSSSGSTVFDMRAIDDSLLKNIEILNLQRNFTVRDLTITNNHKVFLTFNDVNAINDQHKLRIDGGVGDQVALSDFGWTEGAPQTIESKVYDTYTNGQAVLLVGVDVDVQGIFS